MYLATAVPLHHPNACNGESVCTSALDLSTSAPSPTASGIVVALDTSGAADVDRPLGVFTPTATVADGSRRTAASSAAPPSLHPNHAIAPSAQRRHRVVFASGRRVPQAIAANDASPARAASTAAVAPAPPPPLIHGRIEIPLSALVAVPTLSMDIFVTHSPDAADPASFIARWAMDAAAPADSRIAVAQDPDGVGGTIHAAAETTGAALVAHFALPRGAPFSVVALPRGAHTDATLFSVDVSQCSSAFSACSAVAMTDGFVISAQASVAATARATAVVDCTAGRGDGVFTFSAGGVSGDFTCSYLACGVSASPFVRGHPGPRGECVVLIAVEPAGPITITPPPRVRWFHTPGKLTISNTACTSLGGACSQAIADRALFLRAGFASRVSCADGVTDSYDIHIAESYDLDAAAAVSSSATCGGGVIGASGGSGSLLVESGGAYANVMVSGGAGAAHGVHFIAAVRAGAVQPSFDVGGHQGALCGVAGCVVSDVSGLALRGFAAVSPPEGNVFAYVEVSALRVGGTFHILREVVSSGPAGELVLQQLTLTVTVPSAATARGTANCVALGGDRRRARVLGKRLGTVRGAGGVAGDGTACVIEVEVAPRGRFAVQRRDYAVYLKRTFVHTRDTAGSPGTHRDSIEDYSLDVRMGDYCFIVLAHPGGRLVVDTSALLVGPARGVRYGLSFGWRMEADGIVVGVPQARWDGGIASGGYFYDGALLVLHMPLPGEAWVTATYAADDQRPVTLTRSSIQTTTMCATHISVVETFVGLACTSRHHGLYIRASTALAAAPADTSVVVICSPLASSYIDVTVNADPVRCPGTDSASSHSFWTLGQKTVTWATVALNTTHGYSVATGPAEPRARVTRVVSERPEGAIAAAWGRAVVTAPPPRYYSVNVDVATAFTCDADVTVAVLRDVLRPLHARSASPEPLIEDPPLPDWPWDVAFNISCTAAVATATPPHVMWAKPQPPVGANVLYVTPSIAEQRSVLVQLTAPLKPFVASNGASCVGPVCVMSHRAGPGDISASSDPLTWWDAGSGAAYIDCSGVLGSSAHAVTVTVTRTLTGVVHTDTFTCVDGPTGCTINFLTAPPASSYETSTNLCAVVFVADRNEPVEVTADPAGNKFEIASLFMDSSVAAAVDCAVGGTACATSAMGTYLVLAIQRLLWCNLPTGYRVTGARVVEGDTWGDIVAKVSCDRRWIGSVIPHASYRCLNGAITPQLRGCGRCGPYAQTGYSPAPYAVALGYIPVVPAAAAGGVVDATTYTCHAGDNCESGVCLANRYVGTVTSTPATAPTCRETVAGSQQFQWRGSLAGCIRACQPVDVPAVLGRALYAVVSAGAPMTMPDAQRLEGAQHKVADIVTALQCAHGWVRSSARAALSGSIVCTNGRWAFAPTRAGWCDYPADSVTSTGAIRTDRQPCGPFVPRVGMRLKPAYERGNFDVAHGYTYEAGGALECIEVGPMLSGYAQCVNGRWVDQTVGCRPVTCPSLAPAFQQSLRLVPSQYIYVHATSLTCAPGATQQSAPVGALECVGATWRVSVAFTGCIATHCTAGALQAHSAAHIGYVLSLTPPNSWYSGEALVAAPLVTSYALSCAPGWSGAVSTPPSALTCIGMRATVTTVDGRLRGCVPPPCTIVSLGVAPGYEVMPVAAGTGAVDWATARCTAGYRSIGAIGHPTCTDGVWVGTWTNCVRYECANGVISRCDGECRPLPAHTCRPLDATTMCCTAVADTVERSILLRPNAVRVSSAVAGKEEGYGSSVAFASPSRFAVLRGQVVGVTTDPVHTSVHLWMYEYDTVNATLTQHDVASFPPTPPGVAATAWHSVVAYRGLYVAVAMVTVGSATPMLSAVRISTGVVTHHTGAVGVPGSVVGIASATDGQVIVVLGQTAAGALVVELWSGDEYYGISRQSTLTLPSISGVYTEPGASSRPYSNVAVSSPHIYVGHPGTDTVHVIWFDVDTYALSSAPPLSAIATPLGFALSKFGTTVAAHGAIVVVGAPALGSCVRGAYAHTPAVGTEGMGSDLIPLGPDACPASGAAVVLRRFDHPRPTANMARFRVEAVIFPPRGVPFEPAAPPLLFGRSVVLATTGDTLLVGGAFRAGAGGVRSGAVDIGDGRGAYVAYRTHRCARLLTQPVSGEFGAGGACWYEAGAVGFLDWRDTARLATPPAPTHKRFDYAAATYDGVTVVVGAPDVRLPPTASASVSHSRTQIAVADAATAAPLGAAFLHTLTPLGPAPHPSDVLGAARPEGDPQSDTLASDGFVSGGVQGAVPGGTCGPLPYHLLVGVSVHTPASRLECGDGSVSGAHCSGADSGYVCDHARGYCGRPSGQVWCTNGAWSGALTCSPCVCQADPAPVGVEYVVDCDHVPWGGTCVARCTAPSCGQPTGAIGVCNAVAAADGSYKAAFSATPTAVGCHACYSDTCDTSLLQAALDDAMATAGYPPAAERPSHVVVPGKLAPGAAVGAACNTHAGWGGALTTPLVCDTATFATSVSGVTPCTYSRVNQCTAATLATYTAPTVAAQYTVATTDATGATVIPYRAGTTVDFTCAAGYCSDAPLGTRSGIAVCSASLVWTVALLPAHCRVCRVCSLPAVHRFLGGIGVAIPSPSLPVADVPHGWQLDLESGANCVAAGSPQGIIKCNDGAIVHSDLVACGP